MKALSSALVRSFVPALMAVSFAVPVSAQSADQMLAQAQQAYASRDYDAAGIQQASESAALYGQLVAQTPDAKVRAAYLVRQAEALYFVGNANTANDVKIEKHLQGMELADQAVKLMGIPDVTAVVDADVERLKTTLSREDLVLLAEGLYQRGTNLGQWGAANGVLESLSKWPELRDNMQLIVNLGLKDIHEFGPLRTLGRGFFKIPGLLGGSTKKADKYLATAVTSSLVAGQVFSVNGYNNVFYAEILKDIGQESKAREILQAFIAADVTTLKANYVPENRRAQADAAELLRTW